MDLIGLNLMNNCKELYMQLSILYVNDVHGYLQPHPELFYEGGNEVTALAGGYPALATCIKQFRKLQPDTLLFDGGDTFHGTLPLVESKGEVLVPVLNEIGFDSMVGHWDFAYGPEQLIKLAAQLNYPLLGINIYKEDGSLLLQPFLIKQVKDIKIGIIGICSNIIDKTMPGRFSEGLKITSGEEELPHIINQLKIQNVDIIILLSHNGFPQDLALLARIPGIDICLSAHTHNRLYETGKVNNAIIIQCGCHGSFAGHLQLEVEQKKIINHSYSLITIDSGFQPDPVVKDMVDDILQSYGYLQDRVGETSQILHRYNTLNSSMDNLLLSAIAETAGTSIAFSNGWRYGAPIPAGPVSLMDLYNIIPMNPVVSTVELTGTEIINMLEENLERTFSPDPLKQMGGYVKRCFGIHVKMRIENPKGHRIQQIFTANAPINRDRIYKVAFVTSQGIPEKYGTNRHHLNVKAVDAMKAYLQRHSIFSPGIDPVFSLV